MNGYSDVKDLFSQAVVLPPELRAEFLDLVESRNPHLRTQLEQLLAFNEGEDPLLDHSLADTLDLAPEAPTYEAGDILKRRYRIEEPLGRGGFSHVYLARDTQMHGKLVVVKVLLAAPRGWDGEIQALARINHPTVLDALDWGVAESGHPFLISEYIEGVTLREALRLGPIPLERTVRIVTEVAEGLEAAHRQGVLHLDIKPENIVLSGSGGMSERASVIDFGIAHLADAARQPGMAGSPDYMAPEMRSGQTWAGCDVYALGLMTFEMLAGRLPDPSQPTIRQLSLLPARTPARVADAIVDATLSDPRKRTGSARRFASQLNEAFERSRRTPVGKIALAAGVALLGMVLFARHNARRPAGPGPAPITTHPLVERQATFSPDGRQIFFSGTNPATGDFAIYAQTVGQHRRLRLTTSSSNEFAPACSPDGKRIAFLRNVGAQTSVVVIPSIGGQETVIAEGFYDSVAWAADSATLLASERPAGYRRSRLMKIDTATREMSPVLPDPEDWDDLAPSLSPDGHTLAFVRESAPGQSEIYLLSVDQHVHAIGDARRLTYHEDAVRHPQWTPDSKEIVYVTGPGDGGRLWRIRRDGPGDARELFDPGKGVDHPTIPRNAWKLAFTADLSDTNLWKLDLDSPGGRVTQASRIASSSMKERLPRLSPDGKHVVFVSTRSGSAQVWISPVDGGDEQQRTFLDHSVDLHPFWVDANWLGLGLSSRGMSFCLLPKEGRSIQRSRDDGFAVNASSDGQFVFFRGGPSNPGLWRAPVDGGQPKPVAPQGAIFAVEPAGGLGLWFSRSNPGGVWKIAKGHPETQVLGPIADPYSFAVGASGVYYISPGKTQSVRLRRFNGQDIELVRMTGSSAGGLDVSENERTVVFAQHDSENADIMMIDLPR